MKIDDHSYLRLLPQKEPEVEQAIVPDEVDSDEETSLVAQSTGHSTTNEPQPTHERVQKQYLHLGIEAGLTGKSPGKFMYISLYEKESPLNFFFLNNGSFFFAGLVYRQIHYRMLKIAATINRNLFHSIFVGELKKYDPASPSSWFRKNDTNYLDQLDDSDFDEDRLASLKESDIWSQIQQSDGNTLETCFWIDVNIDGISLFNNSTMAQVK